MVGFANRIVSANKGVKKVDHEVSRSRREDKFRPTVAVETLPINNGQTVPFRDVAPAIPGYLRDTYTWAYLNPRNVKLLDRELVVATILWWQHRKLERMALAEIDPGSKVLQNACV